MTQILAISSSPNPAASKTKALIDQFIESWLASDATADVVRRDLGTQMPAHLDGETIAAFYTADEALTDRQKQLTRYSDAVIAELAQADVIVIGVPMHNFGIPSTLKAWIDHVARVGKTFKYTDNGPVGLLTDKRVIILGARGGNYSETGPMSALDQQTPYLKTALNFIGLTDQTFVYAEGVAGGDDGMRKAETAVRGFVAEATLEQAA